VGSAEDLSDSLKLVEVGDFTIIVCAEGAAFGNNKLKVRGTFRLADIPYRLMITDPVVEKDYVEKGEGEYEMGGALLCISLGEPHDGYVYKLIAGVMLAP
jgi:hypothetical protein